MKTVAIYGIGNFGYAFLKHLENKRSQYFTIRAYDRNQELIQKLQTARSHLYFHKSVRIGKSVNFVKSPEQLLANADVLILAVASNATREVLTDIRPILEQKTVLLNTAKALDYETGERLSEIAAGIASPNIYAAVAGGTIAKDLFKHEPLGVDVACKDNSTLNSLVSIVESNNLTVRPTQDLAGVEYASSFKNVVSIFAGIVKGLGFSYGAETHLISHLAQSIGDFFINNYGVDKQTFGIGSQCWGNDLWMSCTGPTRNREFGILLGKGTTPHNAIDAMSTARKTVEGINTVRILKKIPGIIEIPELNLLYRLIVSGDISIADLRKHLLTNTVN